MHASMKGAITRLVMIAVMLASTAGMAVSSAAARPTIDIAPAMAIDGMIVSLSRSTVPAGQATTLTVSVSGTTDEAGGSLSIFESLDGGLNRGTVSCDNCFRTLPVEFALPDAGTYSRSYSVPLTVAADAAPGSQLTFRITALESPSGTPVGRNGVITVATPPTATPTNTPVPTSTSVPTSTPVPPTSTSVPPTATSTSVPPTAANTATAAPTNTAVPSVTPGGPTVTPTATPTATVPVSQQATVRLSLTSSAPSIASSLPTGTTIRVVQGATVFYQTVTTQAIPLPQSFNLTQGGALKPFTLGTYTVEVTPPTTGAGSNVFQAFTQSVVFDTARTIPAPPANEAPSEIVSIQLLAIGGPTATATTQPTPAGTATATVVPGPTNQSTVRLRITSADTSITQLPTGTNVTITQGSTTAFSATFNSPVNLPAAFNLTQGGVLKPFSHGTYVVRVTPPTGGALAPYLAQVVLDTPRTIPANPANETAGELIDVQMQTNTVVNQLIAVLIGILVDILNGT